MGIGQHARPQVGVLWLGPIIIREDVPLGALLGLLPPGCHFAVCLGPGNRALPGL